MRKFFNSLSQSVELPLKSFHLANFTYESVNATIQIIYDVCFFDRYDNNDETLKDDVSCNKRRRGELELDKQNNNIIY